MTNPKQNTKSENTLTNPSIGKSASGNTIIGEYKFIEDFSPSSVTKICTPETKEVKGQIITVIDTVGLSDTDKKITDAQTQIEKKLQRTNLDVFLLVIKLGEAFTKEKREAVKWIQENFGANILKHTIVLFTHRDALTVPIEKYLSESETLRSVVDQCSGGYHVFNNKENARSQVTELLEKINTLRVKNNYRRYTDFKKNNYEYALKNVFCILFASKCLTFDYKMFVKLV
uniref:AIG1-type G domain-containing protein n=1 Tax=Cyprinus carpio TaxID=7962 RepID=A0A8C1S4Z6_CYPCA